MSDPVNYNPKNMVLHFARYNARANRELVNVLSRLTDKARKRDCGSWFGSIHKIQ